MTYDEMLQAHVRDFDRIHGRIREIMLEKNYNNDDSPEMRELKVDVARIIGKTFTLKCCYGQAQGFIAKELEAMK